VPSEYPFDRASQISSIGATVKPMTPTLTLNNGVELPALGLGVFQTPPEETRDAVRSAATGSSTPRRPTATSVRLVRPCTALA